MGFLAQPAHSLGKKITANHNSIYTSEYVSSPSDMLLTFLPHAAHRKRSGCYYRPECHRIVPK